MTRNVLLSVICKLHTCSSVSVFIDFVASASDDGGLCFPHNSFDFFSGLLSCHYCYRLSSLWTTRGEHACFSSLREHAVYQLVDLLS